MDFDVLPTGGGVGTIATFMFLAPGKTAIFSSMQNVLRLTALQDD